MALPFPQNEVTAGAVNVFVAMTGVTVTACVTVSVLAQGTADILTAFTDKVVEAVNTPEVRVMELPVPIFAEPELLLPLNS